MVNAAFLFAAKHRNAALSAKRYTGFFAAGAFVQRKVFRIEQMLRPRATAAKAAEAAAGAQSRTAAELHAVVADSERAAHKILHELEKIDDAMRALETADGEVRANILRGMQRNVTAIYEACHFQ